MISILVRWWVLSPPNSLVRTVLSKVSIIYFQYPVTEPRSFLSCMIYLVACHTQAFPSIFHRQYFSQQLEWALHHPKAPRRFSSCCLVLHFLGAVLQNFPYRGARQDMWHIDTVVAAGPAAVIIDMLCIDLYSSSFLAPQVP